MILSELKKYLNLKKLSKKKDYNDDSNKGSFFVHVEFPKNLSSLHSDLPFLMERMKIEKFRNFKQIYIIKKNILYT